MMKDVQFLNRETTSNEILKVPKSIRQQALFRKGWFHQNIVESILQLPKSREYKQFELFLFQNSFITQIEHDNYINNIPYKPKQTTVVRKRDIEIDKETIPPEKQPKMDDQWNERLNEIIKGIQWNCSIEVDLISRLNSVGIS